MKHIALGLALPLAALGSTAHAGWTKVSTGGTGFHLGEVSSPNGVNVFVAGTSATQSGYTFQVTNKVYASSDGGQSFTELSSPWGVQSGVSAATASALFFVDSGNGWLALGTKIWRTSSAGASWASVDAGFVARDLHFFDSMNGIGVGDDGAIRRTNNGGGSWTAVTSPTTTRLRHMFWLDAQRGWATGYDEVDIGSFDAPEIVLDDGVVLRTTDGGASWTQVAAFDGQGVGPISFLADGQTGWLATHTKESDTDLRAALHTTTNGGASFTSMSLPLQVGQLSGFGFTGAINTSTIVAMRWSDAQHGRLVATAFVTEATEGGSGGGGGSSQTYGVYRTVDYLTANGGSTWEKTDLGTISVGIGTQVANDGALMDGQLHGLTRGWAAGHFNGAWRLDATCATAADCGAGLACSSGACVLDTGGGTECAPACGAAQACIDGSCQTVSGGDDGDSNDGSSAAGATEDDGGCRAAPAGLTSLLGSLGLALAWRRRRGAGARTR